MRARTALLVVTLAGVLGVASLHLLAQDAERWEAMVLATWSVAASLALIGLLWLYMQILVGPRSTVPIKTIDRIERQAATLGASKAWFRKGRLRRLAKRAGELAARIEPAAEAHNVRQRRIRLTNAILALIAVLSLAFWMISMLGPQLFPRDDWYLDAHRANTVSAAWFSFEQVTRGTLFDIFDVFDWNPSGLKNDPKNIWFSGSIVVYRLLVGGALIVALLVRFGMRDNWHERAAQEAAENMKSRLTKLAGG